MTKDSKRTVTYTLQSRATGVPGLERFSKSLEQILTLQDRIRNQGDVVAGLRAQAQESITAAQRDAQAARQAAQAKKAAGNEYATWWRTTLAAQEQAERRAHQEGIQRLRDRAATTQLNARLAAQAEREAQQVTRAAMRERAELMDRVRLAHAQARAEYDRASGQARDMGEKTRAAVAYRQAIVQIHEGMAALGKRTDLTTRELTQLAQLQQRVARESTTLGGGINTLGLSGNVSNAIQGNLPRITTALTNSIASLGPVVTTLSPSLGAAAMNSGRLATAFTGVTGAAGPAGLAVAAVGGAALIAGRGILTSVNAYADLEKAMNGLKATSGANAVEMKAMRESAQNVGKELGFLTRDVIAVQEELSKGGVGVSDIIGGAAQSVAVLAKATGVDFKQAVDIAVPVMNVWNLSGSQMMQVADAISNGANKSALDIAGLAQSLQQSANSAEASGLSLNETVAVLAALADRGMQGSDAGTSLKVMLQRLQAPTKEATAALKEANVAVFDGTGKQRDMIAILSDVMDALDGMTDKQRAAFLQTVFGSDATRAITSAWKTGKGTLREYIEAMGEQGTALNNAKTRTEGLRGAQDRMNSAWDTFKTKVGELFTPAMTTVINMTTTAIEKLTSFTEWLNKAFNGDAFNDLGTKIKSLEAQRDGIQGAITAGYDQLNNPQNPNYMRDAAARQELQRRLTDGATELLRLNQEINTLKQQQRELGASNVATGKANLPPGVQGPGFGGEAKPVPVQIVAGKNLFSLMGMAGRNSGTPYGQLYDPDGDGHRTAHVGEDRFAPVGTRVLAPFTGYAQLRQDAAQGNIVDLFDKFGQRLSMIHLDKYADGLAAEIKKAGGRLLVEQGTWLGNVGQTGTSANAQLGAKNSHLHVHAYVNGKPVDVNAVQFTGVEGGTPYAPGSGLGVTPAPANSPGTTKVYAPPTQQALIAEARRILAKIKEYEDSGNIDAKIVADRVLKAFTDAGPRQVAAVEFARSKMAELSKETSRFGQGYDKLKAQLDQSGSLFKINDDAQSYIKSLDGISKAAQDAAAAERKKNGETDKYRALLDLAGDAAGKARSQREAISREEEREADEAEARAKAQQRLQAQLAEQLRQGKIQDARLTLQELTGARDQELKLAEGNAAKRLAIERQYAESVRKAQRDIADAEYSAAKRAAENRMDSNTTADIGRAGRARDEAYRDADREAKNRVDGAVKGERDAVRGLREEYSRLADGVREKVAAGTFDAAAQQEALKAFNALGAKVREAGLYTNEHAVAARRSAFALIDQGVATADLIRQSGERLQQIKDENTLLDAQVEDASTTIPSLTGMLSELIAQDLDPRQTGFVQLLEEIISKGGKAGAAAQYVLDNLTLLEADLGGNSPEAIQFRGKRAKDEARARFENTDPLPGEDVVQATADQVAAQVIGNVFRKPETVAGQLMAATGAVVSDAFADMGTAGREAFWEEFALLVDDPEVGDIGPQLARVLLRRLTDAPEFDALRAKLTGILDGESAGNLTRAEGAVAEADALAETDPDGALGALQDTLTDLWAAAGRGEDAADAINLVTDAINRLTEAREKGEKAALSDLLTGGNTDAAAGAVKAADDLAGDGQYAEALEVLEDTLSDLYAAAEEGEDAADAINTVIDAINRLTKARDDAKSKDQAKRDLEVAEAQDKVAASTRELAAAMGEQERPYADQIRSLEKLKKDFPELGKEIDALIEKWKGLQAQAEIFAGFQKFATGLSSLFKAFGASGAASIVDGLTMAVNEASKLPGQLKAAEDAWGAFQKAPSKDALGGLLGAAGTVLGSAGAVIGAIGQIGDALLDLSPVMQKNRREWAELAQASQQAMGNQYIGGGKANGWLNPYYDALKRDAEGNMAKANAGFWQWVGWTIFGGAPQTLDKAAAEHLQETSQIFNEFGSSLYSTMEQSLMDAIDQGDFSQVADNVDTMLNRFVQQLYVRTLLAKSNLKSLVEALAEEQARGGDTTDEREAIRSEIQNVIGQAEAGAPALPGYGAGGDSSTPGSSPAGDPVVGANFYVANSSKIDLFDTVIQRADAMYLRHEGILTRHGDVLARHADVLERVMREGIRLTDAQGNMRGEFRT